MNSTNNNNDDHELGLFIDDEYGGPRQQIKNNIQIHRDQSIYNNNNNNNNNRAIAKKIKSDSQEMIIDNDDSDIVEQCQIQAIRSSEKNVIEEGREEGFNMVISEYISVNREYLSISSMSSKAVKYLHKHRLEERGYRMTNKKLGEGGFGAVYKVYAITSTIRTTTTSFGNGANIQKDTQHQPKHHQHRIPLACKIMLLNKENSVIGQQQLQNKIRRDKNSMLQAFSNEVFVMRSVPHPNIVAIKEQFIYSHAGPGGPDTDIRFVHSYIIMEYASGGTLYNKLKHQACPFSEHVALGYFRQLCSALEHLHRHGIAHRDLKLGNILLIKKKGLINNKDKNKNEYKEKDNNNFKSRQQPINDFDDEVIKLTDFGLSRLIYSQTSGLVRFTKPAGTLSYMSPELVRCYVKYHSGDRESIRPYNCFPVDIWALGVCLFLMLCKVQPFDSPPRDKMQRLEFARQMLVKQCAHQWAIPEPVRQILSEPAVDMVNHLMEQKHHLRYNIYQVVRHNWLKMRTPSSTTSQHIIDMDIISNTGNKQH